MRDASLRSTGDAYVIRFRGGIKNVLVDGMMLMAKPSSVCRFTQPSLFALLVAAYPTLT